MLSNSECVHNIHCTVDGVEETATMSDYGSYRKICPPKTILNPLVHALKEEIEVEKERMDGDLQQLPSENDRTYAKNQAFRALKEEYEQVKFKAAKAKQSLLKGIVLKKGNDELRAQLRVEKKRSEREILAGKALMKENEQLKAEIEDVTQSHFMLTTTKEELEARVRQLERTNRKLEEKNLELEGDLKLGIEEARATKNELESRVCQLEDDNCKLKRELLMESMHGPRRGEELSAVRKAWSRTDLQDQ